MPLTDADLTSGVRLSDAAALGAIAASVTYGANIQAGQEAQFRQMLRLQMWNLIAWVSFGALWTVLAVAFVLWLILH